MNKCEWAILSKVKKGVIEVEQEGGIGIGKNGLCLSNAPVRIGAFPSLGVDHSLFFFLYGLTAPRNIGVSWR